MKLIDEVVGYANANAEAAKTNDEQQTWAAHHRNCVRIRDEHAAEIERLRAALDDMIALCRHKASNREEEARVEAAVAARRPAAEQTAEVPQTPR